MGMIAAVRKALRKFGYTVHDSRQEKIGTNEIVVELDDISIEQETTVTYIVHTWILLEYDTMDPDAIGANVVRLVKKVEDEIVYNTTEPNRATFKFNQIEVNRLGMMYRVSLVIEIYELVNLDS